MDKTFPKKNITETKGFKFSFSNPKPSTTADSSSSKKSWTTLGQKKKGTSKSKKPHSFPEMKEKLEESIWRKKCLESRMNDYLDNCLELMILNLKLKNLMEQQRGMTGEYDLFDFPSGSRLSDSDSESGDTDEDEVDFLLKSGLFKGQQKSKCCGKAKSKNTSKTKSTSPVQKGFILYNQYRDGTSELKLDDGVFSVQIDVGGSPNKEILIDSIENHLTVKSKDSNGEKHVFGIICPKVDDVDKMNIHYPTNGLLTIDGPNGKGETSETNVKSSRPVPKKGKASTTTTPSSASKATTTTQKKVRVT